MCDGSSYNMLPQGRLSSSLFGQLFNELHFLRPVSLRMGYTHPMDDGQERTFKVKFEGEGVDDYGGPYREVFAQAPSELQMITTSKGIAENTGIPAWCRDVLAN